MKRAFIYTGGKIFPPRISERPGEGDLILSADAGYLNAKSLGVTPQIAVGDFDTMDASEVEESVERISVPAEKDESDTRLAVGIALARGANDITIVGGLGGRLDHTLSNLSLLEELEGRGVHARITDGCNRIRLLKDGGALIPRSEFSYLSLIPLSDKVKGVTVEGCKYPLKKATLTRTNASFSLSNEIVGNCALVEARRGSVWIVESVDS